MDTNGGGRPADGDTNGATVLFGPDTDAALETHYLVIPDEVWRSEADSESELPQAGDWDEIEDEIEDEEDSRYPEHPDRQRTPVSRATAGGIGGVTASVLAGVAPSLIVGPAAALVAGVIAGVFGGLMGHSVGVEVYDRKHRAES